GDWVESTPLGKAEWIKFFGALFNKNKLAQQQFEAIENAYHKTKQLAKTAKNKPKVISGSLYNDKWYLPNGTSWQAQFIKDANANYMYKNTSGSGSLALAFESVLNKASEADIWISPGSYTSYETMLNDQPHYKKFKAFSTKKVYSVAQQKGETGGVLFYELAPNRPDLVLKDLVKVFHPELLPHHNFHFFSPLQ
ncbi:MAG: ABC transporter substrate-binding protein, partial [Psychroflexus salarius]